MKTKISVLLLFALLFSFSACTKRDASPVTPTPAGTTQYPITITDHAGREVTIPEQPVRIVSGYYISTSTVIALGLKERLVGIEAMADKRSIYKLSAPELIDLPNVGTAKAFDLEGCIALSPDLVILPLKLKSAADSLEALGIPTLLVNPESQELLLSMTDMLARAAGVPENARKLCAFQQEQENVLSGITGEAPTVYLAGNAGLLSAAGNNMYQSSMIRLAGGVNAAAELDDRAWVEISYEQLLTWDPDYIILSSDAACTVEDVLSDANLADCRAVVNGNVFHMPGDVEAWDSPIPGGILGSLWLASILHPEQLSPEEAFAAAVAFYERFYDFTLS